ncbi:MAG: diaminopimelate epimerase [Candidatus Riflebacteria bacterium]|nr:diaminopimelate epimerase [Candidatus Riflebacteria bacterium]
MISFQKMHHLGNSFVFFSEIEEGSESLSFLRNPEIIKMICDPGTGLGSDGVVFLRSPANSENHVRMQMFNKDGSEAEMCANALLGLGHKYLQIFPSHNAVRVETVGAVREIVAQGAKNNLPTYKIKLGKINFDLVGSGDLLPEGKRKPLIWQEEKFEPVYASVGNPHAVLFMKSPMSSDSMLSVGAWLETHSNHPKRINVEFASVVNEHEVAVNVWERGCGITSACGTGAAAVAAAGIKNGKLKSPVTVKMPGGEILIEIAGENVFLTGSVTEVASGHFSAAFFNKFLKD